MLNVHLQSDKGESLVFFLFFFFVVWFATGLKKAKAEGKKCHAKTMKSKKRWQNLHVPLRQTQRRKDKGRS